MVAARRGTLYACGRVSCASELQPGRSVFSVAPFAFSQARIARSPVGNRGARLVLEHLQSFDQLLNRVERRRGVYVASLPTCCPSLYVCNSSLDAATIRAMSSPTSEVFLQRINAIVGDVVDN